MSTEPEFPRQKKERRYSPDPHRLLPQATDAERGVLSSMLIGNHDVRADLLERLTRDHFATPAHGTIFEAMSAMVAAGKPLDFIALTVHLRDAGVLEACGGAYLITELSTELPTAANAGHYAEILEEKKTLRDIIEVATRFAGRAYDEQDQVAALREEFAAEAGAIGETKSDDANIKPLKSGLTAAFSMIEQTYHTRGGVVGLPTGLHQLDRMTGGLRNGQLVVIAGRPSMGKSALLWNMAEHISVECGLPCLCFSLEMNEEEVASRMLCGRAKVNLQRIRDGFLSQDQVNRTLPQALEQLATAPVWLDDTPGISIQTLRRKARRFVRRQPKTAAIVIDYLQLMCSTTKRAQENRVLEVGEISGGLKKLARELNRPVIVAAQLNRENDGPKNKPKLSNLRESGSIEQDADVAILLHRAHYYTHDAEDEGKAVAILAKQRNGPTGEIELKFDNALARFTNPEGQNLYSNDPAHRQGGAPAAREEFEA